MNLPYNPSHDIKPSKRSELFEPCICHPRTLYRRTLDVLQLKMLPRTAFWFDTVVADDGATVMIYQELYHHFIPSMLEIRSSINLSQYILKSFSVGGLLQHVSDFSGIIKHSVAGEPFSFPCIPNRWLPGQQVSIELYVITRCSIQAVVTGVVPLI